MSRRRRLAVPALAAALALGPLSGCGPVAAPPAPGADASDASAAPAVVVPALGTSADGLPTARVLIVRPDGVELTVDVRVAATPEARARGLMGVVDLPAGTGMLFRFPDVAAHGGFWMKDTRIALDIAFAAAGEVVAVARMTPCAADPCPVTRPERPYDVALEVPGGWFAVRGVGPGARLTVLGE